MVYCEPVGGKPIVCLLVLFCFVLFCFVLLNLYKAFLTLLECITFNCFCAVG